MLETQRRKGASVVIYVAFSILIAAMVYSLAPSGRGGREGGCSSTSNVPVVVDGQDTSQTAFMVGYGFNGMSGRQKTFVALDGIIRRELLAQAAEARGIRVNDETVDEAIKHGWFFFAGQRIDASPRFFIQSGDEKFFSASGFKNWVGSLNVSTGSYREEQKRGMQAAIMAELIKNGVRVSRDEALADYLYDNDTVTYDVVAFDPNSYRAVMHLTDADLKRFLDGHAAEVEARYKADTTLYKGVKPQLSVREIFIPKAFPVADKKPDDKATDKTATDKKPASNTAENPRGLPLDAAKAKLEAVRAQIAAGKLKFVDAEKQLAADSSDDSPQDNGDRGWMPADTVALGDKEINDATKTLKPGELSPVVVTDRGSYLVTVVDKREGDLSFDQVKLEIASKLAKDAWAKEAAKRDALKTLADAQGGKTLDQMFERASAPPASLEDLLNNPNLPPATREQIQKMMQQKQQLQQQRHEKHGALETHEVDVPVGWFADADGSSGGAPTAAGSAAPAAGSGSAVVPAAGAGSGSAVAPAAAVPPAPAPVSLTPSNDVLPATPNVGKPHVERLGPSPRQAKMAGLGASKDAANALFDELAAGQVGKAIYVGEGDTFVVVQLVNRAQPKVDEFDKTADHEVSQLQDARGKAALGQWLKERCETLTKAGKIKPASDRIRETDDKGNPAPTIYHPCMYFDAFNR